jgi:hypothetical protein
MIEITQTMKLISTLILTLITIGIQSQEGVLNTNNNEDDFNFKKEYKSYLTKALSNLSTGNSFTSLGNFASVSTTDESLKASIFFLDEEKTTMYTFTVSAGASDGISALLNEGKLNSKATIGGEIRFLPPAKSQKVDISTSEKKRLEREIADLENEKDLAILQIIKRLQSGKEDFRDNDLLNKRRDSIFKEIEKINKAIVLEEQKQYDADQKKKILGYLGNIKKHLEKLEKINQDDRERKIDLTYYNREVLKLDDKYNDKKNEIQDKIDVIQPTAINLKFWSFGYAASREDFYLFDKSLEKDKQVFKEDYVTQTITGAINFASNLKNVNNKDKKTAFGIKRFLSGGVKFSLTNNTSGLDKFKVIDSQEVESVTDRMLRTEQEALVGDYKKDVKSISLFSDNYIFLNKESSYAIHINPEFLIKEFQKPITSIQFGLLLPFKKSDEQTSKVNLEFFYQINDLFNNVLDESSFQRRNQIGIQTSFPFNF